MTDKNSKTDDRYLELKVIFTELLAPFMELPLTPDKISINEEESIEPRKERRTLNLHRSESVQTNIVFNTVAIGDEILKALKDALNQTTGTSSAYGNNSINFGNDAKVLLEKADIDDLKKKFIGNLPQETLIDTLYANKNSVSAESIQAAQLHLWSVL